MNEDRNKKIYIDWRQGVLEYLDSADSKDLQSTRMLGDKYSLSAMAINRIVRSEAQRRGVKSPG